MKSVLSFLCWGMSLFLTFSLHAQEWEDLGRVGYLRDGFPALFSMCVDAGNVPYVLYTDYSLRQTFLKKYDGHKWVNMSSPPQGFYLALDNTGIPYVIAESKGGIIVEKLVDTNWQQVGNKISYGSYGACKVGSIQIDNTGVPYVAFFIKTGYNFGDQRGPLLISKLEDGAWKTVVTTNYEYALSDVNMIFDKKGDLFFSYFSYIDSKPTIFVAKYNDKIGELKYTADSGFSALTYGCSTPLVVDSRGELYYVCEIDRGLGVMHFRENKWDTLDVLYDLKPLQQQYYSATIDGQNALCISYPSSSDSGKLIVIRYENGVKEIVSNFSVSKGEVFYSNISANGNGPLFVAYQDKTDSCYIRVKRFGPAEISGIDTMCIGGETHLVNPSSGGAWSSEDTTIATVNPEGAVTGILPGETSICYTIGDYSVRRKVTVSDCYAPKDNHEIMVSPNPSSGVVSVVVFSPVFEEANLAVTDVSGRKIVEVNTITNTKTKIILDEVPSGIYLICAIISDWKKVVRVQVK